MQDIPKLFTALAEWGSCLVFVMILKKRFSHVITAGIMLVYLAVLCLLQHYIVLSPISRNNTAFWRAAARQEIYMEFLRIPPERGSGQPVTCSTSGMGLRLK